MHGSGHALPAGLLAERPCLEAVRAFVEEQRAHGVHPRPPSELLTRQHEPVSVGFPPAEGL